MSPADALLAVQRWTMTLDMTLRIGCHAFRVAEDTAIQEFDGKFENVQAMATHASPRTTVRFDRTGHEIMLDEVERITI